MKKVMLLALGALLAASVSAQEPKRECPQLSEKVCPTKEQRIEMDIKHFILELYLSDKQAEKSLLVPMCLLLVCCASSSSS